MAIWLGAIASAIAAGTGLYASMSGGGGQQQQQGIYGNEYAQAVQDAIDAKIRGAETSRLGRAGYTDSSGSGLRYDPATNTWVSTLGEVPQRVQNAADQASISRNTTDLRQAQGANERADINASRAQPLIDAAMRRFGAFRPQTGTELSALLTEQAVDANNQTYNPLRQDLLRQLTRTGSGGGQLLGNLGREQSADLRRGMIEARLAGMTGADQINNTRRQGLASDLQTALGAGTPSFQYPGIVPSTNNKDMQALMQNRATGAAYANALSDSNTAGANRARGAAASGLAGSIPSVDPFASGLYSAGGQVANLAKDKSIQTLLNRWFGDDPNSGFGAAINSSGSGFTSNMNNKY